MHDYFERRPFAGPILIIDTETTGLMPAMGHRVVELGAIRLENGEEVAQLNTLLNPGRKMDADASRVNGIVDHDLVEQPAFTAVIDDLVALADDALIVAHNAAFDASFLSMEFYIHQLQAQRETFSLANPWLCTLELARSTFRFGRNNLGAIADRLGVRVTQAHRALADVYTTAAIFRQMVSELDRRNMRTIGDLMVAQGGEITMPTPPDIDLPDEIEAALADGRPLTILYQSNSGYTRRAITPLYPTRFRNEIYLIATCHLRREQRTFKLSKIRVESA